MSKRGIAVTKAQNIPQVPTDVQLELCSELGQTSPKTPTAAAPIHSNIHAKIPGAGTRMHMNIRNYTSTSPISLASAPVSTPSSSTYSSSIASGVGGSGGGSGSSGAIGGILQHPGGQHTGVSTQKSPTSTNSSPSNSPKFSQPPSTTFADNTSSGVAAVGYPAHAQPTLHTRTVPSPAHVVVTHAPGGIGGPLTFPQTALTSVFPAVSSPTTLTVDQFETVRRHAATQSHDPRAQLELACRLCEAADRLAHRYTDPSHPSSRDVDAPQQAANRAAWTAQALSIARHLSRKIEFAEAHFFMGCILSSGSYGAEANSVKALEYYLRAAKQDHDEACYRVAVCEEFGVGTVPNIERAMQYYKRAALQGNVAAMYKLAMFSLNPVGGSGSLSTAHPNDSSTTLIENPDDKAKSRNFASGIAWLERAAAKADSRNPHALHELGLLYEHAPTSCFVQGDPLPLNEAKALEMYTAAASLGYASSQARLGRALEFGELGCEVDPVASLGYYYAAANQGDSDAELSMAGWCWTGGPSLPKSDSEALQWAERAAQKGNARALYCLGYFYEIGVGQNADPEQAMRCYEMAAQQGHTRAIQKVASYRTSAPASRNAYPIRAQVMKRAART